MQNQVERFGRHMFQEGSVVIPGTQVTYSDIVTNVQLASTFAGETIDPKQYFNETTPVIITGATSGVSCHWISRCNCNFTTFITFKIFKFWDRQ